MRLAPSSDTTSSGSELQSSLSSALHSTVGNHSQYLAPEVYCQRLQRYEWRCTTTRYQLGVRYVGVLLFTTVLGPDKLFAAPIREIEY